MSFWAAGFWAPGFWADDFWVGLTSVTTEESAVLPPAGSSKRRWAIRKNGRTHLFDDVQEVEDFLKEEPGERTVIREDGKKTVVLKAKHKLPDVEKVVSQWKLEAPQILLPTVDILRHPMQDANLVMPKKVDTDEEDFMEFLSIL